MTTPNHRKIGKRLLAFLATAATVHAAGVVQTSIQLVGINSQGLPTTAITAWNWTGDAINGSVPSTPSASLICCLGWYPVQAEFIPGTPNPTAGYSVTITDSAGVDILAGVASSLSATAPQSFSTSPAAPPIQGTLTLNISGQNVAAAKGTVYVFLNRPGNVNTAKLSNPLTFPIPIGIGGTGQTTQPAALTALLGSSVIPVTNGGTGVTAAQGNGTKTQRSNGTTTTNDCVKFDANGNTVDFGGPCVSLPAGTQTQYLRVQPNTGNNTTLQFNNLPVTVAADYNFPTQSPAGTIAIGANTVTLTPVPLGVNGTDTNHSLYLNTCSGGAQAVTITGGTAVSGAASGTVTFTAANSCNAGFTIQSATSGVAEAYNTLPSGTGSVFISSNATFHAGLVLGAGNVHLIGPGKTVITITRASDFPNGNLISAQSGATVLPVISDMFIVNGTASQTSGAAIADVNNGQGVWMEHVFISGGFYGVDMSSGNLYAHDIDFTPGGGTTTTAVFHTLNNASGGGSIKITSCSLGTLTGTMAFFIEGTDDFDITNCFIGQGAPALKFAAANSPAYISNVRLTNVQIDDSAGNDAIIVDTGNTGGMGNFSFINVNINPNFVATSSHCYQFGFGSETISNINIVGGECIAPKNGGIFLGANVTNITISGMVFVGPNPTFTSGVAINTAVNYVGPLVISGIKASGWANAVVANGALGGVTLTGSDLTGNTSTVLNFVGNVTASVIANNNLGSSTPVSFGGTVSTSVVRDNRGLDDVTTAVASAAALAFPANPNFTITGTTGVTSVSGLWASRTGTFITTAGAVAFTAGATIGASCTTTQNKLYNYYYDGTKMWMTGSGC